MAENKFLVPQYIETEPKILGPVTVRQFILMLLSAMVGFVVWKIFQNSNQNLGIGLAFFQFLLFALFAFTKVNGQNFHYFFLNIVKTLKKPKLRIWRKEKLKSLVVVAVKEAAKVIPYKPRPSRSRLSDLSLMVDTGGAYNVEIGKEEVSGEVTEMKI